MGQNYRFLFYAKNLRILKSCFMKIFPTVIYKTKLLISNIASAKNNFKYDFSIFRLFLHPQIPDFQIVPEPTSMKAIYSAYMMS